MRLSDQTAELFTALAEAQTNMTGAIKDASNPFFKSSYADLTSVIKAIKKPISDAGLAVAQFPISKEGQIGVRTLLTHTSGQFMEEAFYLPIQKLTPQEGGSAVTYAKRYALAALFMLPTVDDDSEAAMFRNEPSPKELCDKAVKKHKASVDAIKKYCDENTEESVALAKEAYMELGEETMMHLWLAPTKGGVFTTQQRKLLKYGHSAQGGA